MKEKPILFSTPMVRAIMEGRKTQTRRVMKPQPGNRVIAGLMNASFKNGTGRVRLGINVGDILWVRETYGREVAEEDTDELIRYLYKADGKDYSDWVGLNGETFHWRTSIHMPRAAARLFLEVKAVRVERLQDITEKDAKEEGVCERDCDNEPNLCSCCGGTKCRIYRFFDLWNGLNAKRGYSWESNPWVWVIQFERIKQ